MKLSINPISNFNIKNISFAKNAKKCGFDALYGDGGKDTFSRSKKINPIWIIPEISDIASHSKDSVINSYIDSLSVKNADEALLLLNAVNSADEKYTPLRWSAYKGKNGFSPYGIFDAYLNAKCNSSVSDIVKNGHIPGEVANTLYDKDLDSANYLINDIKTNVKYDSLKEYCENYPESPVSDYLYENYYLKNIVKDNPRTSFSAVMKCKELNKKHGTKIFLSSYLDSVYDTLTFINREFDLWKEAGGSNVVYPKVIDFSLADPMWYDNEAAYGSSRAMASSDDTCLYFSLQDPRIVQYSLRHEMSHINRVDKGKWSIHDKASKDETLKYEIFNNKKYFEEFLNGGIDKTHIDYAYNNVGEFVAVASEGDMNKYSDEFKELLVKMGMPKWQLNLKQNDYFGD